MKKKFLVSAFATGVALGAGIAVFNLYTNTGTYTAPPQTASISRHPRAALASRAAYKAQITAEHPG